MLTKLLHKTIQRRQTERRARAYRDLLRQEAAIGGQLFGPVPVDVRREFVCVNKATWVWHEEWLDDANVYHVLTTRYDVRPHGVYKAQDGQPYVQVHPEEARHLHQAVLRYNEQVRQLYAQKA